MTVLAAVEETGKVVKASAIEAVTTTDDCQSIICFMGKTPKLLQCINIEITTLAALSIATMQFD
ncbi:MAG TPA: hypothetical protein DCE56_40755 [Cyanobacteria bacterium UBA8553]|nr:hypothetical protein [Cyanobacteria bacterium UBA8553]